MNTKLFFTCILLTFCTQLRSNYVEKMSEYDKNIRLYTEVLFSVEPKRCE